MKKKLLILIGLMALTVQCNTLSYAKNSMVNTQIKVAVKKYKAGNYTGCLQDCQNIVKYNPNGIAYYYMAMSYANAGKRDEAIKYYSKVISMAKTPKLIDYATKGKRCLETPDQCNPVSTTAAQQDDLDKFINSNSGELSDTVKNDYEQREINTIMKQINDDKDLDNYKFDKLKDYSNKRSFKNLDNKIAYTDEEVQNAMKLLNEAGYKTEPMNAAQINQQAQAMNPELMQIQSMLSADGGNKNKNDMYDMLPYMLSQQKGEGGYSPQVIQSIIMNSTRMNDFYSDMDNNR